MDTMETIHARASLKSCLSDRAVEPAVIGEMLEAARVAPSARNAQPWRFVVVTDRKIVDRLLDDALVTPPDAAVRSAPDWIVAFARPADDVVIDGKEFYLFDTALAVQNLLLAATERGVVTHLMAGLKEGTLREILGVPTEYRFVIATPLSYPARGSYEEAAKPRIAQRQRKPLKEIAYRDRWGET